MRKSAMEKKKLWRSRGLGDWLKEGQDEYAFSFSVFLIQASIFPIRAGVAWKSPIIDVSDIGLFQITLQTCQWHPAAWMCWVYLWQQKFGFFIPFHPVFFSLSRISFSPYYFPFLSFSLFNFPCLWHVFNLVTFVDSTIFWDTVGYLGEKGMKITFF